jgi:hypothetical protein
MLSYLPCPLPDYLPYTAAGSPPEPVEALLHIARAMTRASHGPAGPRVKSSPRSPQATYPTPPNRPTLHRAPKAPALHLPSRLPYTSRPTYPTPRSRGARPAPPSRPTLHLPADLPYTRRRLPDARRRAVGGPRRAKVSWSPDRPTLHRAPATTEAKSLVSRPTYPAPRPGHEKTTKSRSHNHTPESSL